MLIAGICSGSEGRMIRQLRFGIALCIVIAFVIATVGPVAGAEDSAAVTDAVATGTYGTIAPPVFQWAVPGDMLSELTPSDIAVDNAGNVYVIDASYNRILKFTSKGKYVTRWGSSGTGNGQFYTPTGIALDISGNVYVLDYHDARVQKFDSNGSYLTQWGSYGTGNEQFDGPYAIAADSSGNIYVADNYGYKIKKFTSTGTYLTQWGSSGSANGQFDHIEGIAIDSSGNVYVADSGNNRVQKFTSSGTYLKQWGSYGSGNGQFSNQVGIATDSSGNVYVADKILLRIQKFTSGGTYLTQWGAYGHANGQFLSIDGIAADSSGNIYVSDNQNDYDNGNHRIQKFKSNGDYLLQWGANTDKGRFGYLGANGIATDYSGNIYVADTSNKRIQKFAPNGTFLAQWGSSSGDGQLNYPEFIATDPAGNVYVCDPLLKKYTSNGKYLKTYTDIPSPPQALAIDKSGNIYIAQYRDGKLINKFAPDGTFLSGWGTGGTGNGEFAGASGIAIDPSGNVYVIDSGNDRIQKFSSTGIYVAQWGSAGSGNGRFIDPEGIAADSSGNVYVVDTGNDRVQMFTPKGAYVTQWGSTGIESGQFAWPKGISVDSTGNIYVTDWVNSNFQKFYLATLPVSPTVTGLTPASGVRGKTIVITNLSGTNFAAGATVSLNRTGYSLINATNVTVANAKKITCTFTIPANAPLGLRNIDVKNTNGKLGTRANAFLVKAPAAPSVNALQPNTGKRGTLIMITNLSGTGFVATPKPKVQLLKSTTGISATNVTVVNNKKITCTFTIPAGAATGSWNALVTNGDLQSGGKAAAFTVTV